MTNKNNLIRAVVGFVFLAACIFALSQYSGGAAQQGTTTTNTGGFEEEEVLPGKGEVAREKPHVDVAAVAAAAAARVSAEAARLATKPVSPQAAHQALARDSLATFCKKSHPLDMGPDVRTHKVNLAGNPYDIYLFSASDIVSDYIIRTGEWETPLVNQIAAKLDQAKAAGNPSPLFLDVGSNIGWFTLNMAARGYKVFAVDAMQRNGEILKSSLCLNPTLVPLVTFFNVALSNEPRACIVSSKTHNRGNGVIECGNGRDDRPQQSLVPGNVVRQSVDMVLLGEYIDDAIEVMKIDVEGHELFAMRGGAELFKQHKVKYIISEISALRQNDANYIQQLFAWGYKISSVGFDGPFREFPAGQELAVIRTFAGNDPEALATIYCALA